jgi:hypothetical protein
LAVPSWAKTWKVVLAESGELRDTVSSAAPALSATVTSAIEAVGGAAGGAGGWQAERRASARIRVKKAMARIAYK